MAHRAVCSGRADVNGTLDVVSTVLSIGGNLVLFASGIQGSPINPDARHLRRYAESTSN